MQSVRRLAVLIRDGRERDNLEESEVGLTEEFQNVFYLGEQLIGSEFGTPSFENGMGNLQHCIGCDQICRIEPSDNVLKSEFSEGGNTGTRLSHC